MCSTNLMRAIARAIACSATEVGEYVGTRAIFRPCLYTVQHSHNQTIKHLQDGAVRCHSVCR